MSHGLRIFHLNVRSCSSIKKFDDVKGFLRYIDPKNYFDFIILSETWFKEEEERLLALEGYVCHCSSRGNDGYGGVAVYVRSGIQHEMVRVVKMPFNTVEMSFSLEGSSNIVLLAIYRPPNDDNFALFMNDLESRLRLVRGRGCVIAGDINVDIRNQSSKANTLIDTLQSYGRF